MSKHISYEEVLASLAEPERSVLEFLSEKFKNNKEEYLNRLWYLNYIGSIWFLHQADIDHETATKSFMKAITTFLFNLLNDDIRSCLKFLNNLEHLFIEVLEET